MKKIILVLFLAISLFGSSKNWKTFSLSRNHIKLYVLFGKNTPGDQFGFIKKNGICKITFMWLSLFTFDKKIKKFDGQMVNINFSADDKIKFTLPVSVYIKEHQDIYSIISCNFIMGEKFIKLLKNSKILKVQVNPNQKIAKFFYGDITEFDLDGFSKVYKNAKKSCTQ